MLGMRLMWGFIEVYAKTKTMWSYFSKFLFHEIVTFILFDSLIFSLLALRFKLILILFCFKNVDFVVFIIASEKF